MSCCSMVQSVKTGVKATSEEIIKALRAMKHIVLTWNSLKINCDSFTMSRASASSAWVMDGRDGVLDTVEFKRQVARAKILAEAKRQGFNVNRDEVQGDKLVIRLGIR